MTCQLTDPPSEMSTPNRGEVLLKSAGVFVRNDDDAGLLRYLRRDWSIGELADLLHGADSVVAWMAAYSLSVIGGPVAMMPLARALHHDDPAVVSAAEDGLWRLWFDESGWGVRRRLQQAADLIGEERFGAATAILNDIIARHGHFAEAFNQRAIARLLQDDALGALADCKKAVTLNQCHFGAYAGMGHAYTHLGQFEEACACYRMALKIHPRMEGIRQSLRKVQSIRHRHPVA